MWSVIFNYFFFAFGKDFVFLCFEACFFFLWTKVFCWKQKYRNHIHTDDRLWLKWIEWLSSDWIERNERLRIWPGWVVWLRIDSWLYLIENAVEPAPHRPMLNLIKSNSQRNLWPCTSISSTSRSHADSSLSQYAINGYICSINISSRRTTIAGMNHQFMSTKISTECRIQATLSIKLRRLQYCISVNTHCWIISNELINNFDEHSTQSSKS